jgi:hypothetical protein
MHPKAGVLKPKKNKSGLNVMLLPLEYPAEVMRYREKLPRGCTHQGPKRLQV